MFRMLAVSWVDPCCHLLCGTRPSQQGAVRCKSRSDVVLQQLFYQKAFALKNSSPQFRIGAALFDFSMFPGLR